MKLAMLATVVVTLIAALVLIASPEMPMPKPQVATLAALLWFPFVLPSDRRRR